MARQGSGLNGIARRVRGGISAHLRLAKAPLCLFLGFSALFGFLLADPRLSGRAFLTAAGVFLLAAGGATLNSLQEWRQDGLMNRTSNRPLPRGELTCRQAIGQAVVLVAAGWSILAAGPTPWPSLLGLAALFLYNGVYTVLKRKTIFAVLPGAVCGALPPLIGWLAAGGGLFSAMAGMLFLLLLLWQIPHFWLVMLRYREDYLYCESPTLLKSLSERAVQRLLLFWLAALVVAMIQFAVAPFDLGSWGRGLVTCTSLSLLAVFAVQLGLRPRPNYRLLFIVLNGIFFFNMLAIGGFRLLALSVAGR